MINLRINDAEIGAALRGIEAHAGKIRSAVQNVIARYAYKIAREAKGLAPFDSGDLRKSIETTIGRFAAEVSAGNETVDYAAAVELGRRDNPNYPVQAFLRPAFEANRADLLRDLKAAMARPDAEAASTAGAAI